MKHRVRTLIAATIMVGGMVVTGPVGTAIAGSSCSYDAGTKRVSVLVHPGVPQIAIFREGNEIQLSTGIDCGEATRFNTNKIVVDDPAGHNVEVVIEVGPGSLKPGFKNEPGKSDEIELVFNLDDGTNIVAVDGGSARDHFTLGIPPTSLVSVPTSINLNSNEKRRVDRDVVVNGDLESVSLEGHGKPDRFSAQGGAGTGVPHPGEVSYYGYGRRDTMLGGDGTDTMFGGTGGDVLKGKKGPDDLNGEEGNDVINGGRGTDACNGNSGNNTLTKCEITPMARATGGYS